MTEPQIQKVEKLPEAAEPAHDGQDAGAAPGDHLNRPDQPDFDPAEREPYDDPDTELMLPGDGPGDGPAPQQD